MLSSGTRAKGVELEVRWLASEHFSFTFSGNTQHTTVKGPDTSFQYVPVHTVGVTGANGFGGSYVVWSFDSVRPGDYDYTLIPKSVLSLYGAYTSDAYDWGKVAATLGVTRVTKTSGTVPGVGRASQRCSRARLRWWCTSIQSNPSANKAQPQAGRKNSPRASAMLASRTIWMVARREVSFKGEPVIEAARLLHSHHSPQRHRTHPTPQKKLL